MNNLKSGDSVLIIWNNCDQTSLKSLVDEIKNLTKDGAVVLENTGMITKCLSHFL